MNAEKMTVLHEVKISIKEFCNYKLSSFIGRKLIFIFLPFAIINAFIQKLQQVCKKKIH